MQIDGNRRNFGIKIALSSLKPQIIDQKSHSDLSSKIILDDHLKT